MCLSGVSCLWHHRDRPPHRGACIKHPMSLIHSQCQLYWILLSIKQHGDGALHSGYSGPRWKCGEYLSANFCFMGKFSFHNHDSGVGAVCHHQEAFPLASFQIPASCHWSLNNHLFHSSLTLPAQARQPTSGMNLPDLTLPSSMNAPHLIAGNRFSRLNGAQGVLMICTVYVVFLHIILLLLMLLIVNWLPESRLGRPSTILQQKSQWYSTAQWAWHIGMENASCFCDTLWNLCQSEK